MRDRYLRGPFIWVVTVLMAALVLLVMTGDANASTEHCPDKDNPNKVEVAEGFGPSVTIPDGHEFCVKAAQQASGMLTSDGTEYTVTWTNKGGNTPDISYYIDYGPVSEPDQDPTQEPTPEPTPSVTPTPEPTPTDTPSPPVTPEPVEHDVSVIPICEYGGETVVLDLLIKSEEWYSVTVDGWTVSEVNGPLHGGIGGQPLSGEVAVVHDATGDIVAGGSYDLTCGQDEPAPVETEPVVDTTEPVEGELPNAGFGSVLLGLLGLSSLGLGGFLLRRN